MFDKRGMGRLNGMCLLLAFVCGFNATAQDKENAFFTGIQSHYGFIITHTPKVEHISHTNPYGIELNFNWLHTSFESWRVFRAYNISGFQLAYYNYQNPDIVGSSYVLSAFTEPILKRKDRFIFSLRGGGGLSYQTKIFDWETNLSNVFFSTRISFPLYVSARMKYGISDNFMLTLSGTFNHISNGAMKIPNMGINFPTVSAGLEYFPGAFPALGHGYVANPGSLHGNSCLMFQLLSGYKSVYGEDTWTWGVGSRFNRQIRSFYGLNAGAELVMDKGEKKMIEIEEKDVDYKRFALTAGQDFYLGKIVFSQYMGFYLYSPYKAKSPVYQKYELSYSINPLVLCGVFLKVHGADAELFGFTVNYRVKL